MPDKPILEPGPDHPITIEPNPARVVVSLGGHVVADTTAALTLREAGYAPVQYIPLADVDASTLRPSEHTTYCPYKGDANYYSLSVDGSEVIDAVWTYRAPYAAVAEIREHVAFYLDRVDAIADRPAVGAEGSGPG
jgi:uncharacterized protein (DUF427 family)